MIENQGLRKNAENDRDQFFTLNLILLSILAESLFPIGFLIVRKPCSVAISRPVNHVCQRASVAISLSNTYASAPASS